MDIVTKPVPSNTDTLWDALDVARYCKTSRSWVYQQAESGRLPHLRVGGLLRFDPERVKAFARGEPRWCVRFVAPDAGFEGLGFNPWRRST